MKDELTNKLTRISLKEIVSSKKCNICELRNADFEGKILDDWFTIKLNPNKRVFFCSTCIANLANYNIISLVGKIIEL